MSLPFDATLKEIVSQAPTQFVSVFHLATKSPVATLNVDLSTISAATDVAIGCGDPLTEIVDLNFQSGPDSTVAARVLLYNAALHLKFMAPVRSIIVVLRPKADHARLDGKLSYGSGGNRVSFEYDVIRMWQHPAEPFLDGDTGLLPLVTLCKLPTGKSIESALREVVHAIDRRLAQIPDHAQAVRWMAAAFTLVKSRVHRDSLSQVFEGVRIMHKPTVLDEIDDAEISATKRLLFKQGCQKFGDPDAKDAKMFHRIKELARLERMVSAILDAKSWKELLAVR
jgi:hypothetical protein